MWRKTVYFSLILFLFTTNNLCFSQQKKISFSSKQSKGITLNNKKLLILWNNVLFKNNKSKMYCDSATYDRANNSFIAYHNIKINENDSLELFGDSLHYFGDDQMAYIYGNVFVKTSKISLKSPSLIYDQARKIAFYNESAIINDKNEGYTIKSKQGTFNTNNEVIYFKKEVVLNHPDYEINSDTLIYHTNSQRSNIIGETKIKTNSSIISCHKGWFDNKENKSSLKGNISIQTKHYEFFADSIFYNENNGLSYAEGNVKIIDDSSDIIIEGTYGFHNENTDSAHVWNDAILTQLDSTDTLKIYADQFINISDSLVHKIYCFNNVVIDGTQIQGDCDSIYYNETDSIMKCIVKPVIWMDESQVTGDKIEFKTHGGVVEKMYVQNNAMIITQKDSLLYDQIKGDIINGYFQNNKMSTMDITGKGKIIYYSENENDSSITEINKITCEEMRIHLKDNRISNINFKISPLGISEPINETNSEGTYLENFYVFPRRTYSEKKEKANGE